ncbi:GerAB/ArcD/ProY family transporter [Ureibacillus thermosphaericus]|uniref:GerAB/ArcD/ProY family transporter n=1 Tax=Ureibacillus thermosphaericus TaxID=51173 RepID=UPI000BBB7785|nr:endospore germination permease [Ureibacillus thermosphaericus]
MKHTDSISSIQLAVIIASTIIGVSLLVLPRFIAAEVGEAAILASIVGILISLISVIAITLLARKFREHTIIGCNRLLLGKYFGNLFNYMIVIVFIVIMGLEVRQFAEVLATGLLPNTPIEISILIMIIICALVGYSNVSTFTYIHFFYLPFLLIPMFFFLFALEDIEIYHLLPILGHNLSVKQFLSGAIIMTQVITNYFVIAMLIPYIKDYENCVKNGIWGFFLGALAILYCIVVSLGVFGAKELQEMYWPILSLSRIIQIPGEVLSRIDAIILITWIFAVFTTLLSYYFVIVRGTAELFRTDKYSFITVLMIPVIFVFALIPNNVYEIYEYASKITYVGLFLFIILPVCLLIIGHFRKRTGVQ